MMKQNATNSIDLTVSKGLFRLTAFALLALVASVCASDAFAAPLPSSDLSEAVVTNSADAQSDRAPASTTDSTAKRRPCQTLSEKQRSIRLKHAHELLGRYYKKSSVNVGESIPKINSAVYHWTKEHLPAKFKDQSNKIAQTIIDESTKQQFDPVFLMSVIEGESSWRPEKIGSVGEIGLMQLRPSTGKWMASRAGVKWKGDKTLLDPCSNVKIGAAYLSYLRDRFDDHARLYLAAYNMGQSNVDTALDKNIWPKDYPIHVMKRYVAFYESVGPSVKAALAQEATKLAGHLAKAKMVAGRAAKSVKTAVAKASKKASASAMSIVVKYHAPRKAEPAKALLPGEKDDTYFDVDKLVHSDESDVNDPAEQKADADSDVDPATTASQADGRANKT